MTPELHHLKSMPEDEVSLIDVGIEHPLSARERFDVALSSLRRRDLPSDTASRERAATITRLRQNETPS